MPGQFIHFQEKVKAERLAIGSDKTISEFLLKVNPPLPPFVLNNEQTDG